jgi:hypothetical protein
LFRELGKTEEKRTHLKFKVKTKMDELNIVKVAIGWTKWYNETHKVPLERAKKCGVEVYMSVTFEIEKIKFDEHYSKENEIHCIVLPV